MATNSLKPIRITRQVHFYETDAMKVVHHTNYLRYFEEARVAWGIDRGVINPKFHLAVIDLQAKYIKPLMFGDTFHVEVQARLQKLRLIFQYRILKGDTVMTIGETTHVPLDEDLKLKLWSDEIKETLRSEPWIETWL